MASGHYIGGSLEDLVESFTGPTRRAARNMAEAGGDYLVERAQAHTPVETGEVRESWHRKPTGFRHEVTDIYESGVESEHYRARWVEHGVKPHRIEPDDEQAIETPEGPRAGADHPGFTGFHPVANAAAELEAKGDAILRPEAERWKQETEAEAASHPGITRT